jgi:anthranilate/para-aminobenzoate synthase component I
MYAWGNLAGASLLSILSHNPKVDLAARSMQAKKEKNWIQSGGGITALSKIN